MKVKLLVLPRGEDKLHPDVFLLREYQKINTFWFSGGWMFSLLTLLISAIFNLAKSKKYLLLQACLYKKEIEVLKRQNMKNDNLNWGYKKIQGELLKLGISLDQKTIQNILNVFRRRGKVKKSLSWKKFLKLQIHSIYAMDFFTIDTILNQRLYVYFILYHKTREIVQFAITTNPTREFVRQQVIEFEQKVDQVVYMIHDHAAQFNINYIEFGIKA
jgi:hypothetical protein